MPTYVKKESKPEMFARLEKEGRLDSYKAKFRILVEDKQLKYKKAELFLETEFGPGRDGPVDMSCPSLLKPHMLRPKTIQMRKAKHAEMAIRQAAVVTPERFVGKTCDERVTIRWVFENLECESVRPDDAPSAGAWGLLQNCKRSESVKDDFIKSIWSKLIPSKSSMEISDRFTDDGHEVLEMIGRVRLMKAKAEAESAEGSVAV